MFRRTLARFALSAVCVVAHPHCWIDERPVDLNGELDFCSTNNDAADGVCCTDAEEAAVLEKVSSVVGSLTAECGDLYKQVECAMCGSYSGHLYERLDGLLTMTNSFCESFTSACAGQLDLETDYCDTRTDDDGKDYFWSYPYTAIDMFEPGLTKVFPDLPDGDMPDGSIFAVHQSPDGRMYWIAGREGMLKQVMAGSLSTSSTVMDLTGGVIYTTRSAEEGILDFAFSPLFETNGYFYVSYNVDSGVVRNRLSKFVYSEGDPDATRASEEVLLESSEKPEYMHNGGWVGFKPSTYGTKAAFHDIYWSIGDSGPQEDPNGHGQGTDTIFGSVVRISVPSDGTGYEIPNGNYPSGLPEICAIGFRGHWRCGFDKANDDLYCGDVGYKKVESIFIVKCGNNYGWARFEGSLCTDFSEDRDGACLDADRSFRTPPTFEYCHFNYDANDESEKQYTGGNDICGDGTVEGNCVIGGHVYRGEAYSDLLAGAYVFADYMGSNIYYIKKRGDGTWTPGTIVSDGSVRVISFTETIEGELMIIDKASNIYHLPCGDLCNTDSGTSSGGSSSETNEVVYAFLGCFTDAIPRVLTGSEVVYNPSMTAKKCAGICQGSTYFGTEYKSQCFCGPSTDNPDSLGPGTCDYPCNGDADEMCGGMWSISVYEFTST